PEQGMPGPRSRCHRTDASILGERGGNRDDHPNVLFGVPRRPPASRRGLRVARRGHAPGRPARPGAGRDDEARARRRRSHRGGRALARAASARGRGVARGAPPRGAARHHDPGVSFGHGGARPDRGRARRRWAVRRGGLTAVHARIRPRRSLRPLVTLHHFTKPLWIADRGGWESRDTIERFADYARFCAREFGGEVDWWCTVNEPEVYAFRGWSEGLWPPRKRDDVAALEVMANLLEAPRRAYRTLHHAGRTDPAGRRPAR